MLVLCGAVLLLATACADGHGHSPRQLSEMITETDLGEDEWSSLVFPDDFGADPTTSGMHTVLWTDGAGDPITCDGFEVD